MEAKKRISSNAMSSASVDFDAQRYTLFALLRRLEREYAEKPRLGASRRPSLDVARLEQTPLLTFAAAEIADFAQDGSRPTVTQNGLGMMGPNGALPLHLTEWIYEGGSTGNATALVDFVNLVQRRLLSLVYRAWAAVDPAANYDRPGEDEFRLYVGALVGLADPATRGQTALDDRAVLGRAGLFARGSRPGDALESVLASHFEVTTRVIPFVPEWLEVPPNLWTRLGVEGGGLLGRGLTLGSRTWQCQYSFEIVLGPLTLKEFRSFLPDGNALEALRTLVSSFAGDEWSWRLRLVLPESAAPRAQLGSTRESISGTKLGWETWLGGSDEEARDVVLRGANEIRL